MLVKDGQVFLDLKDENFRRNWTGSQIKARTAIGVMANHHLIMATIEPSYWQPNGPGSIAYFPLTKSLVIRASAELHYQLAQPGMFGR